MSDSDRIPFQLYTETPIYIGDCGIKDSFDMEISDIRKDMNLLKQRVISNEAQNLQKFDDNKDNIFDNIKKTIALLFKYIDARDLSLEKSQKDFIKITEGHIHKLNKQIASMEEAHSQTKKGNE